MTTRNLLPALVLALLAGSFAIPSARTQTTSGQSNYIFRFNTGVSGVFLSTMTFASEQTINLGACQATEKINGPISCTVNCNNDSVCLLEVNGPSGSSVNDVMEKVSETPSTGASPSPSASALPGIAGTTSIHAPPGLGGWFQVPGRDASSAQGRVEAYNSVRTSD